jgi:Arc/MetJ-type ribon-helix-helix transcriptional regulator
MQIDITPQQSDFIRLAIEAGRLQAPEDAVQEALSLWVERERRRAEILAKIEQAEASVARGEGRIITRESMRDLTEEVHQAGLARLAEEAKRR